ncbi:subtilisin-like protein [Xylariaceae sp. FL0662B]|nr:subtilisin-like protein [Xylariaceae sp. FL0662B]
MRSLPLFALLGARIGYTAGKTLVSREVIDSLPTGWSLEADAKADEPIELSIMLKQPKMEELKARLSRTSDPLHEEYGHHLTRDETRAYQVPDSAGLDSILSWLGSNNITNVTTISSVVTISSTANSFNKLLNTTMRHYSFDGSFSIVRAQAYSIPQSLERYIDFIHPISNFMPPQRSRLRLREIQSSPEIIENVDYQPCPVGVTPACLRALYNVTESDSLAPTESLVRFGIGGFLEQWIKYADVSEFLGRYLPDLAASNYNFTVATLNNGTNPQEEGSSSRAGIEASLDVEYAMALGYPTNVIYYSTGGRGAKVDSNGVEVPENRSDNEPYLEFLQYLLDLSDDDVPHVISISYADDEQSVPAAYAARVCDLFAQLAARGVSVLTATGDGGASGIGQNLCYSNDGTKRKMFLPTFPASCPYVTAVGATGNTLPFQGAEFSTGGFSNYFATPEWQRSDVDKYIAAINGSHQGLYNETGRAIPDISASGTNYVIQVGGYETDVLGTSASTPVVAALIALVNDARLKVGKNSTGWLNPALYSPTVRGALVDVVDGVSQDCVFDKDERIPGWESAAGYDCVTGLGSVGDFRGLLEVLG